jgi:phosphatidylglycerol:prolipoprotein diacylglycerol transferase
MLKWTGALFARLSRCINRPLIFEYRGYYFFFGYAVWWGIGSFLSLTFLSLFLLRSGLTAKTVDLFELIFVPVTILGSHIFWFGEARLETNINSSAFSSIAGFTSWGGLGGAVLVALAFAYGTGSSIFMWLDCIVPLLLMHFFGRLGCAFYGCCYGKPTRSNIYLSYTHRALKAVREKFVNPERLYPVQFFSALYGLISFSLILLLEFYLPLERGLPIVLSLLLYGTFRFTEGWYRTQKRIFLSFFSIAQFAAVTLVLTAAALLLFYFPNPAAPHYEPLANLAIGAMINELNFPVLIILSAFTAFSFGYHRREIGRWR